MNTSSAPSAAALEGRRRFLRRAGFVAAVLPAAAAVDGLAVTPRRLVTSDIAAGAGLTGDRLRVVQVSDLHVKRIGTLEHRLLEALHAAPADVVVITGDALDRADRLTVLDRLLGEFPRGPRTLAILGNWEHRCAVDLDALDRTYRRHGIELLVNRSVEVTHHGGRARITGLDDFVGGRPDARAALATAAPLPDHLVLAHCPSARDALGIPAEHAASLLLAGHTHGGQVAPFGVATVLPPGCGRYVAGWYRDGGPPMYVSRGIGTSLVPVRIGATPELVRLDWQP
jgi:predicted MPP superfamily phosphohydrolase